MTEYMYTRVVHQKYVKKFSHRFCFYKIHVSVSCTGMSKTSFSIKIFEIDITSNKKYSFFFFFFL